MFDFYSDPGHGWLEVRLHDLNKLNLKPTDFSGCSYRSGATLYLEEDCDAGKFIDAWLKANPLTPKFPYRVINSNHDSFVRSLPRN